MPRRRRRPVQHGRTVLARVALGGAAAVRRPRARQDKTAERIPSAGSPRRRRAAVQAAVVVVATFAAAGATAVIARAAAAGCSVAYTVTNQWQGGFGADVTLTNLGDPITDWTLTWSFGSGQAITQAWNATVTQSGAAATARALSYNASVPTNGQANFGFTASWTNSNPVPTAFTLNGVACTGSPTSPPTTSPPTSPPTATPTATPTISPAPPPSGTSRQVERLDRGVVSVPTGGGNLVSWRLLGTDPQNVSFNVYRGSTRLNGAPVTATTNVLDSGAAAGSSYTVRAVVNGAEQPGSPASINFSTGGFLDVPISPPAGGTTPDGVAYTYTANDASVGDLDGDGQYEFILKWDPTNAKDNSQSGYTGDVFVDAYRLNGQRLWRIDLGRNIRAGAHYTQFQVYDYSGDGRAEVAMKTSDATVDGTGRVIGNASADYRNSSGYVLTGPEFLTMFNGSTGAAMSTVNYDPPRGSVSAWGDNYGNRVDRFLAGTAYLDGRRPSLIMARGYYTRTVLAAWDFRNGSLTERWKFDSNGNPLYESQGNHQLSIADADGDGRDEVMYGSMAVDDNGSALWSTNLHHGDAYHVGDLIPSRPGLEVFHISEHTDMPAAWMADARTGQLIWQNASCGCDNGRGVSGDIWAGSPGAESWSSAVAGVLNTSGQNIGPKPASANFLSWWDGDATRELLDRTFISKYSTSGETRLLTASGVHSNNGTKATPSLSADLFGDWREEAVWPTSDDRALRIYSTPIQTTQRIPTLMHDTMYRVAIAWQNTGYNQPPHPSFFIGSGMSAPPWPNIYTP